MTQPPEFGYDPSVHYARYRTVRTLLADHDPISRRVLASVLSKAEQLEVVACADSHDSLETWPLDEVDVAILGVSSAEPMTLLVGDLVARRLDVVVIGVDWDRSSIDAAITAGAAGCLVKDCDLTGLAASICAVASGHAVFSRQLLNCYMPGSGRRTHPRLQALAALQSLTDREQQILLLIADGMSTAEVADFCGVSAATVKSHVSHALTKLGVRSRLEAILLIRDGLDTPGSVSALPCIGRTPWP